MTVDRAFLAVMNMSLTGAFVIAAILLARLFLKQAPRRISCWLWAVAWFRLVCPVSAEWVFSLIPFRAQPILPTALLGEPVSFSCALGAAYHAVGDAANGGFGTVTVYLGRMADGSPAVTEAYHGQVWLALGAYVWLAGAAVLLLYGLLSYALLKRRVRTAICTGGNVYRTNHIPSPFVLGILSPKIYLPNTLTEHERGYILLHEQTHIKRRDHLVKCAAYGILCLHWFNPLVWAAFFGMAADMEQSCDEGVLQTLGDAWKADYSRSLLALATGRRQPRISPLAFGEGDVSGRVKHILRFKMPARVMVIAAAALVALLSVGFSMNRAGKGDLTEAGASEAPCAQFAHTYYLENTSERQRLERMQFVALYPDGTAMLAMPPISSYIPPKCTYSVEEDALLIHAVIETPHEEGFFGVQDGDVIARFSIIDDNTLIFRSATVPLFADAGRAHPFLRPHHCAYDAVSRAA